MALDTKAWMKSVGFSEETIARLLPEVEPFAEGIEKTVLMRSDHSRELDKLRKAEADLAKANEKLTADMAEWAEMTAAEQAKAGDLRSSLEKAEQRVFTLQQKATRLAEEAGIDPKTILGDEPMPEPKKKEPVAFDPTPLQQQIGGIAEYMLTLNAELPAIAQEHFDLTGERLDTRAFIAGIKADLKANKTDNLDPVKRWESAHDIPTKRAEKSAAQLKTQMDTRYQEGVVAGRSEAMLPNTRPVGQGSSPVFKHVTQQSKLQRPQPGDRMAGARAALASGKYRNGGSNAA